MTVLKDKIRPWLAPEFVLPPLGALCIFGSLAAPRGISAMLAIFALAVLLSFMAVGKLRAFSLPRLLQIFLLCFGYFLLSVLWSPSARALEMGRDTLIVMVSCTILFASLNTWSPLLVARVTRALALGFSVGLAYLLVQALFDFPINRWVGHVSPDFIMEFSNVPKRMAAALVLFAWPVAAYIAIAVPSLRQRRWLLILLATVMTLTLPMLFSRTAMVGATAGLLVWAIAMRLPRLGRLAGLLLLPLGIAVSLLVIWWLPFVHDLLRPYLPFSGQERLAIWDYTLHKGITLWPMGAGLDGSRAFGPQIQTHPHNVYLQIFFDGGLPGVLLASVLGAFAWAKICSLPKALQPYCWGFIASQAMLLASAYGIWQGWWLAAHAFAVFMLVLVLKSSQTVEQSQAL